MIYIAERYHDISCGHRVVGHESKCKHLHGHNYRITFYCRARLDAIGRVIDFSAMKELLCMWLENNWDHKTLVWSNDGFFKAILRVLEQGAGCEILHNRLSGDLVWVPFNPTAENMAGHLLKVVAPMQLKETDVECVEVKVEETRKCSATARL